jgi:hypothetical protein
MRHGSLPAVLCLALLSLCVVPVAAQEGVPIPASEVQYRKQIFSDERLNAFLLELPPQHATLMHRHDRAILSVFVNGGRTIGTIEGRAPAVDTFATADVRFRAAGFTHATRNVGTDVFRSVILELAGPQGPTRPARHEGWRYCNPGSSTACVDEKYLFCTIKFCVEDVSMAPGAVRSNHAYMSDQLLVAVSDYSLAETAQGRATQARMRKSGGVEHVPAGVAHEWTNTAHSRARFIVIAFR